MSELKKKYEGKTFENAEVRRQVLNLIDKLDRLEANCRDLIDKYKALNQKHEKYEILLYEITREFSHERSNCIIAAKKLLGFENIH